VMACAMTSLWIRGLTVTDLISLPDRRNAATSTIVITHDRLISENNLLAWERTQERFSGKYHEVGTAHILRPFNWKTTKERIYFCDERCWVWRFAGCGECKMPLEHRPGYNVVETSIAVHPLSVTTLFTLLSAYMLLRNPRLKPSQPVPHA
jgi:hypothetical protein